MLEQSRPASLAESSRTYFKVMPSDLVKMALTLSSAARHFPGLSFHHHPREPGTDRKQHYGAFVNDPPASQELPLQPEVQG